MAWWGARAEVIIPERRAQGLIFGAVGIVAAALFRDKGQLLGIGGRTQRLGRRGTELILGSHDERPDSAPEWQQGRAELGRRFPPFARLGARIISRDGLVVTGA